MKKICIWAALGLAGPVLLFADDAQVFPYTIPAEKPSQPLSAAMERAYDAYESVRPEQNELYTQFRYTELQGFDTHGGDGTISRRDPSKVIYENGTYYVWYTYRNTPVEPVGMRNAARATQTIPSVDWDLSEIWYATSTDGFVWREQGVAVPRPPAPNVGCRSVCTADILKWEGKYYLYYQGYTIANGLPGDDCPIAVSVADSPEGPWTALNQVVLPNGEKGEWDQYALHDPYPLVHDGKIYLYYKVDLDNRPELRTNKVRMQGLAIADHPLGPFKKHPLNPVLNSGHETTLFPFKEGVAALVIKDGMERNTIQYASDWVNFKIASIVELMPVAGGAYVPDAFTNTSDGRGITWGISHFVNAADDWDREYSVLARFDCDLSRDVHDPDMKGHFYSYNPEHYYRHGLTESQRRRVDAPLPRSATAPRFEPTEESLSRHEAAPEWFQDAKLGIYFHWGPYSVPAFGSAWYPCNMYQVGSSVYKHHVTTYGPIDQFGYEDFIPMFKAEQFDPAEWAVLFKASGARFAGPVAEHHDGFAMWASKVNPWNAGDMGPQRDILGDLFSELRKRDMKTIATFHHARNGQRNRDNPKDRAKGFNSHYPYAPELPTATTDPKLRKLFGNFETIDAFNQYWLDQVNEVVDAYSPDILWYDSWLNMIPESYRYTMAAHFFNHAAQTGQEVVTCHKHNDMPLAFSVLDFEQGGRRDGYPMPWMTDITLGQSRWSYVEGHGYKDAALVVRNMIDVWSKNGIVLLNVSPRADGVINHEQRAVLKEIGDWLAIHGEAVYGTRPFDTYGYGTAGSAASSHDGQSATMEYSAADVRFTVAKDGKAMYLFFLGQPEPGAQIKMKALGRHRYAPRSPVVRASLLGSGTEVAWEDDTYSFNLTLPNEAMNAIATVVKLELE